MKVRREDYRTIQEYRKALTALKEWKKERQPKKVKRRKKRRKKQPNVKQEWQKKYRAYLKSPRWEYIKEHIHLVRDGRCERCGSTERLEVHHKHYRTVFHEGANDLELLCHICHRKEHGYE